MCLICLGPKPPFLGQLGSPRVLEPFAALLAARLLEKAAPTFAVLHFVWQSEISPFPYLINIGSGATPGSLPRALLPPLQRGLLQHRAQRFTPTTSLSRSSRSSCCAGLGDLHRAECLLRASLLRLHLELTSSRTPTSLSSRTSQRTTENGEQE